MEQGSAFPLYWKLSYGCIFFEVGCQHAYSKRFNVISQQKLPWNYNPQTHSATNAITFLQWSCSACSGASAAAL